MNHIAEVYVDLAVHEVDRVFHYTIPSHMTLQLGQAVQVPFGHRSVAGIIVGFCAESPFKQLKSIDRLLYDGETVITEEQLHLAHLLAEYYFCPLSLALRQMIPFRLASSSWPKPKTESLLVPVIGEMPSDLPKQAYKQREILAKLLSRGEMPVQEANSPYAVKRLLENGYVRLVNVPVRPQPLVAQVSSLVRPPALTTEQQAALDELVAALHAPEPTTWLLHGVTGSGKTEVYMRLIAAALQEGKQCLMLVPEIALTPQMVERFQVRFGNQIAVWHSGLTPRERLGEWLRIKHGEAQIVIGARSAVFVPFAHLGVIILDEEHEQSYQQEENPRYHTRIVAQLRQRSTGSLLVLGSATPALETYAASEAARCHRLELTQRIGDSRLPVVHIVDMREEFRTGSTSLLSRRLQFAIERCLDRKEQAIILLNRRGYASFLLCPNCGYVPSCSHCDISLTYHRSDQRLHCHYCNYQQPTLHTCPNCGTDKLKTQGLGTERLEAELQARFPAARIQRMDADTTRRHTHADLLQLFEHGKCDILVGTQMIAKGLDFPRVTLVGVVGADMGLYIPDFRSAERTFQLLTQVAGRAGRGDRPGEVIFQTFNPDHYVLECAKNHDYLAFYRQEMAMRRQGAYPPIGFMITLVLINENEKALIEDSVYLARLLQQAMGPQLHLVGPAPCGVSKIKDNFRWQIIIKSSQRMYLRRGVAQALEQYYAAKRRTQVLLDFDA